MATLGIPSSRWNSDWRFLFLGVILLLAVDRQPIDPRPSGGDAR
jgi:hypothetical protein